MKKWKFSGFFWLYSLNSQLWNTTLCIYPIIFLKKIVYRRIRIDQSPIWVDKVHANTVFVNISTENALSQVVCWPSVGNVRQIVKFSTFKAFIRQRMSQWPIQQMPSKLQRESAHSSKIILPPSSLFIAPPSGEQMMLLSRNRSVIIEPQHSPSALTVMLISLPMRPIKMASVFGSPARVVLLLGKFRLGAFWLTNHNTRTIYASGKESWFISVLNWLYVMNY